MSAVIYCGSMGDWPLLTDAQRHEGVAKLVADGIPVIVGTGAQNSRLAAEHAAHARKVGAAGLMVIPRVLSRGTSPAAQRQHFAGILKAGTGLPAVIYNSPYYGFETKADLFFNLRAEFPSLVGFKEFGGAESLTYAAELNDAMAVLSKYDEGPDLVLYYKNLMVLEGNDAYTKQINASDALSSNQKAFLESQWKQFRT